MLPKLPRYAAIAAVFALISMPFSVAPAMAGDFSKFTPACLGATDFLLGDIEPGVDPVPAMAALCTCMVPTLAELSQAEIDVLTNDLATGDTAESEASYADYDALRDKAGEALNTCFGTDEMTALLTPTAVAPSSQEPSSEADEASALPTSGADMANFTNQCVGSARLLDAVDKAPIGAAPARAAVCGCLVADLSSKLDQAGADLLAMGFDHLPTEAETSAYPDYEALGVMAEASFETCIASVGVN